MHIQPVTRWLVDGKEFETRERAIDHVETYLFTRMKQQLLPQGFAESEVFKVTLHLLANREEFSRILGYTIDNEEY